VVLSSESSESVEGLSEASFGLRSRSAIPFNLLLLVLLVCVCEGDSRYEIVVLAVTSMQVI
jgi:hypothetical protein